MQKTGLLVWVLLICALAGARAAEPVFTVDEIATRGQDPVAYHLESKPVKGDPAIVFNWKGHDRHFASTANREGFSAHPERFAPR